MKRPFAFCLLIGVIVSGLGGCASWPVDLRYYWQSVQGQFQILAQAKPIEQLLEDPALDPLLADRLQTVLSVRRFASEHLALPDNGSYRSYVELGRDYVVWNVFAAPELSLELKQWCFPVAGCVSYRGYFAQADAKALADQLKGQGWDVQLAGVPAYSTLGWFNDPVLSSFIRYPQIDLARLIFHELAHQRVYVKGDTTFNESFATAVEEAGIKRWIAHLGIPALAEANAAAARRKAQFRQLLYDTRNQLQMIYEAPIAQEEKRGQKAQAIRKFQADFLAQRQAWGGYSGYDRWLAPEIGNAHLGAVATYTDLVPAFRRLLAGQQGDFARFMEAVEKISRLPAEQRKTWADSMTTSSRDDDIAVRNPSR